MTPDAALELALLEASRLQRLSLETARRRAEDAAMTAEAEAVRTEWILLTTEAVEILVRAQAVREADVHPAITSGRRLVLVPEALAMWLHFLERPGESYSDVICRLVSDHRR